MAEPVMIGQPPDEDATPDERELNKMFADADYATADELLTATEIRVEEIYLPEIRKKVRIRALTGRERDAYEQSMIVGKGPNQTTNTRNARAKLAALTLVDAQGRRLYDDRDAAKLGNLPAIVLERIFDRARKLSGITTEDLDELTGN